MCYKHNVSVAYTTSPEVLRSVLINEEYFWVSSLVSVTKVSFFSLKEFFLFLSSSASIGGLWEATQKKIKWSWI